MSYPSPDLPTAAARLRQAIYYYLNDKNPLTDPGMRLALAAEAMLRAWEHRVRLEQQIVRDTVDLADLQKHDVSG
jgi:hypothetical protein